MRSKSPLSNLADVIQQVKDAAEQYRQTLHQNEAATRVALIDPVLQALGWDIANIFMVEVEKSLASTRIDYALYDRNQKVCILIEAKPLGTNLADKNILGDIAKYSIIHGTREIFLTNGLVWRHITNLQPDNMDTPVIDFGQGNLVDCAAYLVQHLDAARFWPEEPTIDTLTQRVAQLESTLATLQAAVALLQISPPRDAVPVESGSTNPLITAGMGQPASQEERAFVELDTLTNVTRTKPSLLRLPDGAQIRVSSWLDVLRECCKFALTHNPDLSIPLSDRIGKKVRLLDTVRPPLGISFVAEEYHNRTIYMYLNYDANNCVLNAVHVLRQVPSVAQRVKVGVIFT